MAIYIIKEILEIISYTSSFSGKEIDLQRGKSAPGPMTGNTRKDSKALSPYSMVL